MNYVYGGVSPIALPVSNISANSPLALQDVFFFLRVRWPWIVSTITAFLAIAIVHLATAKPTFVADTQLLITLPANSSETQRASAEDAFIEVQLQIAGSSDVLAGTASALDLASDPDFADQPPSSKEIAKEWLMGLLPGRAEPGNEAAEAPPGARTEEQKRIDRIIMRLRGMVTLRRSGRSTILQISAAASSPDKAAKIANTVAQEYIRKNIQMNAQAAQQYSQWLEKFVLEQQRELSEAANALTTFRASPRDQFKLAELRSAADARRALFESTLTRYTEAKQRISYPVSDATIVSAATPPLSKERPRSSLILGFSIAVGTGAGLMLAMIRHVGDRRIIRARQLVQAAGLKSVTVLGRRSAASSPAADASNGAVTLRTLDGMGELAAIVAGLRRRQRTVIGIVAVNPGAGASTTARDLAILTALSGSRTLLIDAAAPKSSLSAAMAPQAAIGLVDVLDDVGLMEKAVISLVPTLQFLPLGNVGRVTPAIRIGSGRTQWSFDALKKKYDTILVDLPAFSASPDANAIAPELDGVLVVTAYGRTSVDDAVRAIDSMRNVDGEILGAVINNAPARMLR
ncbi:GumC family protein [Sinorhizobium chiapasense]|uniref:Cellulose synthase operon protein YhjQ/BcsQ n=1 Tax=Sinorhizobium chiapasense TaxID=501572 RepID=A0ABZ2BI03_9HYPH